MPYSKWDLVVDEVFATFVDFFHDVKIQAKATDATVVDNGTQNDAFEWETVPTVKTNYDEYKEPVVPPSLANSLVQSATGGGSLENIDVVWFSKHTGYGVGTIVIDETTNNQYNIMSVTKFDPVQYAEYQLKGIQLQGGGN